MNSGPGSRSWMLGWFGSEMQPTGLNGWMKWMDRWCWLFFFIRHLQRPTRTKQSTLRYEPFGGLSLTVLFVLLLSRAWWGCFCCILGLRGFFPSSNRCPEIYETHTSFRRMMILDAVVIIAGIPFAHWPRNISSWNYCSTRQDPSLGLALLIESIFFFLQNPTCPHTLNRFSAWTHTLIAWVLHVMVSRRSPGILFFFQELQKCYSLIGPSRSRIELFNCSISVRI